MRDASLQLDPGPILQTAFAFWTSKVLLTAVEFGVFTRLGDRRIAGPELGAELGLHPRGISDFFDALVAMQFLDREGDGPSAKYFNTAAGALYLVQGSPRYVGGWLVMLNSRLFKFWNDLPEALRTGRPQHEIKHGQKGMFEELYAEMPRLEQFMGAMTGLSRINFEAFGATFDFTNFQTLCDVGGGHGHLACGLLRAYPQLSATVFDLPAVVAESDQLWAPKLGLADRCHYLGGDMFREVPPADAYTLKMILHDWNDDECVRVLSNIRRASTVARRVFIAEHVIPGPAEPHFAKLLDVHMMCLTSGRERTASEYADLLTAAGWRYADTHHPSEGLMSVVAGIAA